MYWFDVHLESNDHKKTLYLKIFVASLFLMLGFYLIFLMILTFVTISKVNSNAYT